MLQLLFARPKLHFDCVAISRQDAARSPVLYLEHQDAQAWTYNDKIRVPMFDLNIVIDEHIIRQRCENLEKCFFARSRIGWHIRRNNLSHLPNPEIETVVSYSR